MIPSLESVLRASEEEIYQPYSKLAITDTDCVDGYKMVDARRYVRQAQLKVLEAVRDWAISPEGATAVDLRNRRFIDLSDLLTRLDEAKKV